MSQSNLKQPHRLPEAEHEAAEARAQLIHQAEAQGIAPFDFDAAFGEGAQEGLSSAENRREVDDFLETVREARDIVSARSIE